MIFARVPESRAFPRDNKRFIQGRLEQEQPLEPRALREE
jgi:hypothetical protein